MSKAADSIARMRTLLLGSPVFLTGSLVAEDVYGLTDAHEDIDLFAPTSHTLIATTQRLLDQGFTLDEKFSRVWARWLRYGMNGWHTNSIRLHSPQGEEVNLIFKLIQKQPTSSLAQVLESFDFGLLATGYDLEDGTFRDMRSYLFPGLDPNGPLPLMPNKREAWVNGFISQYNGLRECGRYAKYFNYGYDMSLVKDDLIVGYNNAALYLLDRDKPEKQQLGQIYQVIASYIEFDETDKLLEASKEILYLDSLDQIMESLE